MAFLSREVISFIRLLPSVETDDFMAGIEKFRNLRKPLSTVGSIIVSVQSNKARAQHIKRNRF